MCISPMRRCAMNIAFDLTVTIGAIVTVALALGGWWQNRSRTIDKRIDDCHARLDRHEIRLNGVETALREIPSRAEFHSLDKKMTELNGRLDTLIARLRPTEAIAERLQDVLIEQRK